MPSNPEKYKYEARRMINKIIMQTLPEQDDGLNFKQLIREVIISIPVSPLVVKSFIKEYYVDLGVVDLKDGILFFKGGSNERD